MTILIDGRIPARTPCPFKAACPSIGPGACLHKGTEHAVPFSCGFARAFDLSEKYNKESSND
jgi:hypothetical protein